MFLAFTGLHSSDMLVITVYTKCLSSALVGPVRDRKLSPVSLRTSYCRRTVCLLNSVLSRATWRFKNVAYLRNQGMHLISSVCGSDIWLTCGGYYTPRNFQVHFLSFVYWMPSSCPKVHANLFGRDLESLLTCLLVSPQVQGSRSHRVALAGIHTALRGQQQQQA